LTQARKPIEKTSWTSALYDKPTPVPLKAAWKAWEHETLERLEHIEPLLPGEVSRENRAGMLEPVNG
jgi:hypothetical protein